MRRMSDAINYLADVLCYFAIEPRTLAQSRLLMTVQLQHMQMRSSTTTATSTTTSTTSGVIMLDSNFYAMVWDTRAEPNTAE